MMKRSTKLASVISTAALCMTMVPAMAFAADTNTGISADAAKNQEITWNEAVDNVGDTQYWLQLEEGDMGKISIDVPVRVVLAVNTDGSFVTPTALKNVIENNSEFPVNVKAINITEKDNFKVKAATGFDALPDANIFSGAVKSVALNTAGDGVDSTKQFIAFTKLGNYAPNTAWAMEASDADARTGSDCLFVQIDGDIANVSGHYFTAPINVFDLTYTFEATPATGIDATSTTSLAAPANIAD